MYFTVLMIILLLLKFLWHLIVKVDLQYYISVSVNGLCCICVLQCKRIMYLQIIENAPYSGYLFNY